VAENVDHAFDAQSVACVDAQDAALGDARDDHAAMREIGNVRLGGIFGRAGDFGVAVDSRNGSADVAHLILLSDWD
jgi:hypothetical protein